MRKMEPREKEIFCALHQYKDILCTKSTRKTASAYVAHALNHIMKSNTAVNNNNQGGFSVFLQVFSIFW